MQCAIPWMDTYRIFYTNMLLPALAPLFVLIIIIYNQTLSCTHWAVRAQIHPEQKAKLQERSFTKGADLGREASNSPGGGGGETCTLLHLSSQTERRLWYR